MAKEQAEKVIFKNNEGKWYLKEEYRELIKPELINMLNKHGEGK